MWCVALRRCRVRAVYATTSGLAWHERVEAHVKRGILRSVVFPFYSWRATAFAPADHIPSYSHPAHCSASNFMPSRLSVSVFLAFGLAATIGCARWGLVRAQERFSRTRAQLKMGPHNCAWQRAERATRCCAYLWLDCETYYSRVVNKT